LNVEAPGWAGRGREGGGAATLSNDTVAGNSATANAGNLAPFQAAGGGIYIASKATATFCNDTVESNSASSGPEVSSANVTGGGGIYIESGATVFIDLAKVDAVDPTVVTNNTDNSSFTNGSTANIDGTYILQNC
jgi:hypothetical protein